MPGGCVPGCREQQPRSSNGSRDLRGGTIPLGELVGTPRPHPA